MASSGWDREANDATTAKPSVSEVMDPDDSSVDRFIKRFLYHSLNHSALYATVGLIFPIFIMMIAFSAYPLELQTGGGGWYPRGSEIGELSDARLVSEEQTVFNPLAVPGSSSAQAQQSFTGYALTIYYWSEGGNVFTQAGIEKMREIEDYIYNRDGFDQVCLKSDGITCDRPEGITRWAYASEHPECNTSALSDGQGSLANPLFETLKSAINTSYTPYYCKAGNGSDTCGTLDCTQHNDTFDEYVAHSFNADTFSTYISKAYFLFGLPLAGFDSSNDRTDEQIDVIEEFVKDLPDYLNSDTANALFDVRFISEKTVEDHFQGLIWGDVAMVLASITLVFLYIWFHTKSLFLAGFGIGHVLLSFPFAYFFLQLFLYPKSMGVLNFMSLFIILGIGADDVFILVDAWKQSEKEFPPPKVLRTSPYSTTGAEFRNMHQRLVWSYRRASWAMLVTSFTTAAAFAMNLISSIPPIQIFGFFTAFMVLTNYLMVITYYPAIIMFYEKFVKDKVCGAWHPCCQVEEWRGPCQTEKCCKCMVVTQPLDDGLAHAHNEPVKKSASSTERQQQGIVDNLDEYRLLERVLYRDFGPFVYKRRWYIVVIAVAWTAMCAVFAADLDPSDKPAQWVPDDDPVQQALFFENDDFRRSALIVQVFVMNGIGNVNRDGTNPYDTNDLGAPSYTGLDLTQTTQTQLDYIANCETIRAWDYVQYTNGVPDVYCPMEDFKNWVEDTGGTFPVPTGEVVSKLAEYTAYYESVEGPAPNYADKTDDGEREGRRQGRGTRYQTVRFAANSTGGPLTLRYMVTIVNTTINPVDPAHTVEPAYNYFEDQTSRLRSGSGLPEARQTSMRWVEMKLELVLLDSAYFGILASLILAFVIIVLTTKDFILTASAVGSILFIVVALVCTIVWIGWSVSVVESICLTILVGLSVDYTIHLANSWRESPVELRLPRLQNALLEIGISVVSASITTLLACIPLMFCYILFFQKFGIFIALTVFWSTLYAFFFFCGLLAIYGPVSGRNDFLWIYYKLTCNPDAETLSRKSKAAESSDGATPNEKVFNSVML